jgi:hypothetical protein
MRTFVTLLLRAYHSAVFSLRFGSVLFPLSSDNVISRLLVS